MASTVAKDAYCVANPSGAWSRMTVLHCHDDGTYKLRPEGGSFLDEWDGVTRDEISFDDERLWPALFATFRGDKSGMGVEEVAAALAGIGLDVELDGLKGFWQQTCNEWFPSEASGAVLLDAEDAYRFMLLIGVSAKRLAEAGAANPHEELFKLYWNNIRMGGRAPADVGRSISLGDTLAALGLLEAPEEPAQVTSLMQFETDHRLVLPKMLKQLWSRAGVLTALRDSHCNNPEPLPVGRWQLVRRENRKNGGAFELRIMVPHQGGHAWWAVFDDDAEDAAIWISRPAAGGEVDDGGAVLHAKVAFSLAFFFWDLSETGRCWKAFAENEEKARQ